VEVGSRVGPEDTIGILEVMKLMNRISAGASGVVTAVLVDNGGMVEHGQPLVLIDPSG
jgi:acetyl-CoA carboxylase biotin carboxyl carrier protein